MDMLVSASILKKFRNVTVKFNFQVWNDCGNCLVYIMKHKTEKNH